MRSMRKQVHEHDITAWATSFLDRPRGEGDHPAQLTGDDSRSARGRSQRRRCRTKAKAPQSMSLRSLLVCLDVTLRDDSIVLLATPASVTRRLEAVSRFKAVRPKSPGPDRLTNRPRTPLPKFVGDFYLAGGQPRKGFRRTRVGNSERYGVSHQHAASARLAAAGGSLGCRRLSISGTVSCHDTCAAA